LSPYLEEIKQSRESLQSQARRCIKNANYQGQ
jgi:hypothetical protein